jgi:stage II sporulation protein D
MQIFRPGAWLTDRLWAIPFALIAFAGLAGLALSGCSQNNYLTTPRPGVPVVRVRLLENQDHVALASTANVQVWTASQLTPRTVAFPDGQIDLRLTPAGWLLGSVSLGAGELNLHPTAVGALSVNGSAYRGAYRCVPTSATNFDVINDVDIDGYLMGVLPKELFHNWQAQTYSAQAVVARTYALYEANTAGIGRYWDVYPDQRSQMYGGLSAETSKSRDAVEQTLGQVVVYGAPGHEKIFKAYFSSCCGGVTQAAADAFPGDPMIPPLMEQNVGALCSDSPYFNWGPVILKKDEATRRMKLWATRKSKLDGHTRPETQMGQIMRIDIDSANRYGRPARFVVTDARGNQYNLASEELRAALDTDAGPGIPTLPSSFFRIDNGLPSSDSIRFIDGHGLGHGVGMCQWSAEARAENGMGYEQIVLLAYPEAKIAKAY